MVCRICALLDDTSLCRSQIGLDYDLSGVEEPAYLPAKLANVSLAFTGKDTTSMSNQLGATARPDASGNRVGP